MQQKKALLIAGFVTAVVTTVAVSQGPAVFAAFQPAPVIAEAPAGEVMAEAPAEVIMAPGMARIAETFGDPQLGGSVVSGGRLDVDRALGLFEAARAADQPVVLLGGSFAFVHLLDALRARGKIGRAHV